MINHIKVVHTKAEAINRTKNHIKVVHTKAEAINRTKNHIKVVHTKAVLILLASRLMQRYHLDTLMRMMDQLQHLLLHQSVDKKTTTMMKERKVSEKKVMRKKKTVKEKMKMKAKHQQMKYK